MTTNARDEKWSEWICNKAGLCPVPPGTTIEYKMDKHGTAASKNPERLRWSITGNQWSDITAYRYKIKEPESDIHPDLEWLARNVIKWAPDPSFCGADGTSFIWKPYSGKGMHCGPSSIIATAEPQRCFSRDQWLQARKDLGLTTIHGCHSENTEPGIMTPEEDEAWQAKERELIGGPRKAESFLMQAAELLAERGKQYDQAGGERSMGKTIGAFNIITGRDLTEAEGWLIMTLLKRVRQYSGQGYHKDSAEDGVTYGALEAEALESAE